MSKGLVTLKIKRLPETGEWKVQYYLDGHLDEAKSYYTTDKEDAEAILAQSYSWALKRGYSVEVPDRDLARRWYLYPDRSEEETIIPTRDRTKEEFQTIQDKLFMEYPEELDSLYQHLQRTTRKEPTPAMVVNRFKDEYPERYRKLEDRIPRLESRESPPIHHGYPEFL